MGFSSTIPMDNNVAVDVFVSGPVVQHPGLRSAKQVPVRSESWIAAVVLYMPKHGRAALTRGENSFRWAYATAIPYRQSDTAAAL